MALNTCGFVTRQFTVLFVLFIIQKKQITSSDAATIEHYTVTTPSGKMTGKIENVTANGNRQVISFLGVPFGEPPVGDLRFKPPKLVKPWTGTHQALHPAKACIQGKDETFKGFWGAEMWNANTEMSENCLYLNMWVPKYAKNASVMVWLFGGGFWYGSPSLALYDGRGLAAEGNVIVVNPNYRVGAFGFLFLDDVEVPGNVGLLDQQLALLWIKENIAAFGGDPNKVCLFGESAGAASIVAHMIAPSSAKLYNNGVLQSGSLDNPWAMDSPQKALNKSMQLVKSVGCDRRNITEISKCLRNISAEVFIDKIWTINLGFLEFPLVIVSKDKAGFFIEDAFQALRLGKYRKTDIMIGINADEGTFWMVYYLKQFFNPENESLSLINESQFVEAVDLAFPNLPLGIRQGIVHQYWDKKCVKTPTFYREAVNQMIGDYFFTCDSIWLADQVTNLSKGNVFIYHFEQRSTNNPWPEWMGVMHAYEIEYVFGLPITFSQNYTERFESNFSREIIQFWKTFAEKSKPALMYKPEYLWPPYTSEEQVSMILKAGDKYHGLLNSFKREECNFWRSIRDIEYDTFLSSLTNKIDPKTAAVSSASNPSMNKHNRIWTISLLAVSFIIEHYGYVPIFFTC